MNLFDSPKYDKVLNKRPNPPGMQTKKRFSKQSEFGKQLSEKQKVRIMYGITDRQCRNYFAKASKNTEETGKTFLTLLERRLDNAVFQAGLGVTRNAGRQMVSHGLIKLNGKRVRTPSIQVKVGDHFAVRERSMKSPLFASLEKRKYTPPGWLKVDLAKKAVEVIRMPNESELPQLVDVRSVIGFYSK